MEDLAFYDNEIHTPLTRPVMPTTSAIRKKRLARAKKLSFREKISKSYTRLRRRRSRSSATLPQSMEDITIRLVFPEK